MKEKSENVFGTEFLGTLIQQYPNDMWYLQELIVKIEPDFIIETGTLNGGSALYCANILDQVNPRGKVITIDIKPMIHESLENLKNRPHLFKRVSYLFSRYVESITSNSVDPKLVEALAKRVRGRKVMVLLDSCHAYEHVLRELRLYAPLVSKGGYLIVYDTAVDDILNYRRNREKKEIIQKMILCPGYTKPGGPKKAAKEFFKNNKEFLLEPIEERFVETSNPQGYYKRI